MQRTELSMAYRVMVRVSILKIGSYLCSAFPQIFHRIKGALQ